MTLMKKTILLKCVIPLLLLDTVVFGQTATFSSNFEDQNTDPEIGRALIERNKADMRVVPNPHPDANNSSDYVLKHVLLSEGLQRRSEYTASRKVTNEKKYIYTWSVYHPKGMFKDVAPMYVALNQWKTWPCEAGPISNKAYEYFDTLICSGGGIFNDMFFNDEKEVVEYRVRAEPNCHSEYMGMPMGMWHNFVLEVYWTNTENGYYRIWRNRELTGYSDNIKTLPDRFIEGTCNIFWSNGLYSSWWKDGAETTDSIVGYTDNIAIYDIDSGFSINSICPDCEAALPVPTDSLVYKVNINGSTSRDGFNNNILSWKGETVDKDLSSTYGQSTGIDIYMPTDEASINNTLTDDCFPKEVITTAIQWTDTVTKKIYLKDLTPSNTYTFRLLSATSNNSASYGAQIWTTHENKATVFAANNTCNVAELRNLVSNENGGLTIYVKSISNNKPRVYINAIEIVEYAKQYEDKQKELTNELFPNPANDILHINVGSVPTNVTIYTLQGIKVLFKTNSTEIDISGLRKGIYIASIITGKAKIDRKFIKK
jgi:hypothetical protein